MRVVYLCLQPRGSDGASDTHVDGIVGGLRAAGVEVHLLELHETGSLTRRLVEALRLQLRNLPDLRSADALYVRMHPLAVIAALVARRPRLLLEVNGVAEDFLIAHPGLRRVEPVLRWSLGHLMRRADEVLVVTDGLARYVRTLAPRARITVVPNAADPDVFRPGLARPDDAPEGPYAIFFGALAPWQGVDLAMAAAVHPSWPADVSLLVVGDGADRPAVEAAAHAHPDRIVYLGRRPRPTLPAYVSNAVVSLIPKRYHAPEVGQSPLKLYESAAAGIPVIATHLSGVTDVGALSSCLVAVRPDPASLASTVRRIAWDADQARSMGLEGRHAIESGATWSHRSATVEGLLRDRSVQGTRIEDE